MYTYLDQTFINYKKGAIEPILKSHQDIANNHVI